MLELKGYQTRTLEELAAFLRRARAESAASAFRATTRRPYHEVADGPPLKGLPYVCLRVPTGGGKTLLACHAVGTVASEYLLVDHVLALWLVPSTTIKDQTLTRLRDRTDPYRQAVEASLHTEDVEVLDLQEALNIQRATLDGTSCIVVSTLAALRVGDLDARRVYEAAGSLQHHFEFLPAGIAAGLQHYPEGPVVPSLANVFAMRRPLVIMDEAHNARTKLSFETLARLAPSCILEFTATPETTHRPNQGRFASNVLVQVSAAELKAEHMVKLPIALRMHERWEDAVSDALRTRQTLEEAAQREATADAPPLRPLILFQAQPRSAERETVTVEILRAKLIEDFGIPADQIRVATGDQRELDGLDLQAPNCPVRYIVTVQALREGWDCPWAYVLCSVAPTLSARAVEQILGRVLRMPGAAPRATPALNRAYAITASRDFVRTATSLQDALVESGFERIEAEQLIVRGDPDQPTLFPSTVAVTSAPDLDSLPADLRQRVVYDSNSRLLAVAGDLSQDEGARLARCFPREQDQLAVRQLVSALGTGRSAAPAALPADRRRFLVPWLSARRDGHLEVFGPEHFLSAPWALASAEASLTPAEFSLDGRRATEAEIDVSTAGQITVRFAREVEEQLALLAQDGDWSLAALTLWLDRRLPHPDLTSADVQVFLARGLESLTAIRGATINQLAQQRHRLLDAFTRKIDHYRAEHAREAYQLALDGALGLTLEVVPDHACILDPSRYAYRAPYNGRHQFAKHLFPVIGDLAAEGEEFECAVLIDSLPDVTAWVRNTDRHPETSFWLQTPTDRFYPDFLVWLEDGTVVVLEYKGADRWGTQDSVEKRLVGALWAERSGGATRFLMPRGPDWDTIRTGLRVAR